MVGVCWLVKGDKLDKAMDLKRPLLWVHYLGFDWRRKLLVIRPQTIDEQKSSEVKGTGSSQHKSK